MMPTRVLRLIFFYLAFCNHLLAETPNFIIIFTDDQGYGDLSCFGGDHVSTPRIDQMAAEGARLTSFYAAAPVCTPSRAGLMTGSYAKRVNMHTGSDFGVLLAGDQKGLHPEEITIAEVLKSVGYKTGMIGKWHLGDQSPFLPTRQGFEHFWGIPYSHDIHPFHPRQARFNFPPLPLLDGEKVIEMDPDADYLTQRITEKAVSFIKEHKETPFFLYIPHPIPHVPLHVSPSFMKEVPTSLQEKLKREKNAIDYQSRNKIHRQAISEIDWSVGEILDALKESGIDENTLVIFTSDNGGARSVNARSNGALREGKGSTYEGGMREATVIRWPTKIPAGEDNDALLTAMDLLPTFATLAGAETPSDRVLDGKDISATLLKGEASPHEALFYYSADILCAVRSGKWKFHLGKGKKGKHASKPELYDLEKDIGEKENVIADFPEIAKRLRSLAEEFDKELTAQSRPAGFVDNPQPLSLEK